MTGKINIQISHSVVIHKPAEQVWDFTQDFSRRTSWDHAILDCSLLSENPTRKASIRVKGGMTATLVYKLFDRPRKTSLQMTDIRSPFVIDGGGSWNYEDQHPSTLWTQTNSIVLKKSWFTFIIRPRIEKSLLWNTRQSMLNAKKILEHNTEK